MKRRFFIVLPSPTPTGPIKGGYALANALAPVRSVSLVTLRAGSGAEAALDPRIVQISLHAHHSMRAKGLAYRSLLRDAGGRSACASISMCLSADWMNAVCAAEAVTCASVRGNLPRNYRGDYGLPGTVIAAVHLLRLRRMDHVIAMNGAMADQVERFTGRRPHVIGNFIDEQSIEKYRRMHINSGPIRLVFLGSMSSRKQPLLALSALKILRLEGIDARLDFVGDGPLRGAIEKACENAGLGGHVTLHGFLADPYALLAAADVLLLPSTSEGMARACLEALHLGVLCVLRAVDGNSSIIRNGINGELFASDADLPAAVSRAARRARYPEAPRRSLLPDNCRQATASREFLDLLES